MNLDKIILEQAVNSILHGSVNTVTTIDYEGKVSQHTERVENLRPMLASLIVNNLVNNEQYQKLLAEKVFTADFVKELQNKALESMSFDRLPYDVRRKIEKEMEAMQNSGELMGKIKRYRVVTEVIEDSN